MGEVQEVQKVASDPGVWMWLAGAGFAAWNGLLTFIFASHAKKIDDLAKEVKTIAADREDHCIPRPECERTHHALNERLDRIEAEFKAGVVGIHTRLDKIIGPKGK